VLTDRQRDTGETMAKKRRSAGPSRTVTARVPNAVADALDAAAADTGKPRNRIITEALEAYTCLLRGGLCVAPEPHLAARRLGTNATERKLPDQEFG